MELSIMKNVIAFIFLLSCCMANAEVNISNVSSQIINGSDFVKSQSLSIIPLGKTRPNDMFKVSVAVDNDVYRDISAYVVDEINLNLMNQQLPFRYAGALQALSPINFSAQSNNYSEYFLVFDNRYANLINKKIRYSIVSYKSIDAETVSKIKSGFGQIYSSLKQQLVFEDFDINVKPCNQANAFSNPDITLCTELIGQLIEKNKASALLGILFHELGHSLLNIWGMPGYDNEDTADEFAVSILVRDEEGKKALYDMMAWFSEQNTRAEVQNMVSEGDRHSLSIQRIRNMERIISNPEPVVRRWNKLLYEHYTISALNSVISSPKRFDDVALASTILAKRMKN